MAGVIGSVVRAVTTSAGVLALSFAAFVVPASASAEEATTPSSSSPTSVAVPYLGTATIEPAQGWRISDCAGPAAASDLVIACDEGRIMLSATEYDPEAVPVTLPVSMSNGRTSMVFEYRVTLAAPEAPTLASRRAPGPVAAGSVLLVPISDLGVECIVCAEGGALAGVAVLPAEAGSLAATPTHLVFRPARDFTGDAELVARFADDFGTWSTDAKVVVPVYRPGPEALIAQSVFTPRDADGSATVDLAALAFASDGAEAHLAGCGAAIHGSVTCAADGTARYTSANDVAVDQFSFRVVSADGEQASGSVTVVGEASDLPQTGPVPVLGSGSDDGVATRVVPRVPVEREQTSRGGVFAPLIGTLDRVGAR
ncbi:hypothetical protein LQ757_04980 [Agromyces sp. SYSU K20354]|uniref:Ig-like domain-containing protein n=1 Tax=Agromyces cavernae TaxID=2898659 RepID=UPI001E58EDFA|nr:hypothetical protein [Agromyces cavernae]MCD2441626.1 hypothetical protein [Agromyces cavernae]